MCVVDDKEQTTHSWGELGLGRAVSAGHGRSQAPMTGVHALSACAATW